MCHPWPDRRKGRTLDNVSREEFDDIAQDVGLRRAEPKPPMND